MTIPLSVAADRYYCLFTSASQLSSVLATNSSKAANTWNTGKLEDNGPYNAIIRYNEKLFKKLTVIDLEERWPKVNPFDIKTFPDDVGRVFNKILPDEMTNDAPQASRELALLVLTPSFTELFVENLLFRMDFDKINPDAYASLIGKLRACLKKDLEHLERCKKAFGIAPPRLVELTNIEATLEGSYDEPLVAVLALSRITKSDLIDPTTKTRKSALDALFKILSLASRAVKALEDETRQIGFVDLKDAKALADLKKAIDDLSSLLSSGFTNGGVSLRYFSSGAQEKYQAAQIESLLKDAHVTLLNKFNVAAVGDKPAIAKVLSEYFGYLHSKIEGLGSTIFSGMAAIETYIQIMSAFSKLTVATPAPGPVPPPPAKAPAKEPVWSTANTENIADWLAGQLKDGLKLRISPIKDPIGEFKKALQPLATATLFEDPAKGQLALNTIVPAMFMGRILVSSLIGDDLATAKADPDKLTEEEIAKFLKTQLDVLVGVIRDELAKPLTVEDYKKGLLSQTAVIGEVFGTPTKALKEAGLFDTLASGIFSVYNATKANTSIGSDEFTIGATVYPRAITTEDVLVGTSYGFALAILFRIAIKQANPTADLEPKDKKTGAMAYAKPALAPVPQRNTNTQTNFDLSDILSNGEEDDFKW